MIVVVEEEIVGEDPDASCLVGAIREGESNELKNKMTNKSQEFEQNIHKGEGWLYSLCLFLSSVLFVECRLFIAIGG